MGWGIRESPPLTSREIGPVEAWGACGWSLRGSWARLRAPQALQGRSRGSSGLALGGSNALRDSAALVLGALGGFPNWTWGLFWKC